MAQAVSLGCYALLYRRVLASLGARVPFWLTARVTLASFLVSHVTPFGSAAGTVLNVSTLETEGVATSTTGEAIGLTRLVSTLALIALFGTGLVATAGRHLAHTYLVIAGAALALVVSVLAIHGKAGQAADHAHAQWQSFKADTSAKMQGLRGRIERQRDERDVKAAERDAEAAEDDAANALDYAAWAIDQAEVAVLDAADARAWADARAAASPSA